MGATPFVTIASEDAGNRCTDDDDPIRVIGDRGACQAIARLVSCVQAGRWGGAPTGRGMIVALKLLDHILYRARYAAQCVGLLCFASISTLFICSGTLFPESVPEVYSSANELLGQTLLLMLVPAFLLTYLVIAQRRSLCFAGQLVDSQLVSADPADWLRKIRGWVVWLGLTLGFLYGLILNVPPEWRRSFGSIGAPAQSIAVAQVFLWALTGLVLAYRIHTAWRFHGQGKRVPINLYDTRKFEPFARNGLDDVFAITMLLVLGTLQSLDAKFRMSNYANALLIAFPAAASLLVLPMGSLHRRMVAARRQLLEEMHGRVADASRSIQPGSLAQLELLMQHCDRIRHMSTWPIDFSIASRLMLYVIIPPLAWLGAAFVEVGLDRILRDP